MKYIYKGVEIKPNKGGAPPDFFGSGLRERERESRATPQPKRIKQLGNYVFSKRNNPNQGRVYSILGIAPTINCAGGGQREPHIIEITYERIESISRGGACQHDSPMVYKK